MKITKCLRNCLAILQFSQKNKSKNNEQNKSDCIRQIDLKHPIYNTYNTLV